MSERPCEHLLAVEAMKIPEGGCIECLVTGDSWVHLRFCATCKQIRCCDDSPNQHAAKHGRETDHKVIRSAEPGEMWAYCYADESFLKDIAFAKYMR